MLTKKRLAAGTPTASSSKNFQFFSQYASLKPSVLLSKRAVGSQSAMGKPPPPPFPFKLESAERARISQSFSSPLFHIYICICTSTCTYKYTYLYIYIFVFSSEFKDVCLKIGSRQGQNLALTVQCMRNCLSTAAQS